MADNYPDNIPESGLKPLERFSFSKASIMDAKGDCELQLEALQARIDKITDRFTLTMQGGGEFKVITEILKITHDREELKGLAKGLDRIADIIAQFDDIGNKLNVLDLASKDFNWFSANFGDFGFEADTLIQNLEKEVYGES